VAAHLGNARAQRERPVPERARPAEVRSYRRVRSLLTGSDREFPGRRRLVRSAGPDRADPEPMVAGFQVTVGLGRATGAEFAFVEPECETQRPGAPAFELEGALVASELPLEDLGVGPRDRRRAGPARAGPGRAAARAARSRADRRYRDQLESADVGDRR